jgi:ATP adenylyltransferase
VDNDTITGERRRNLWAPWRLEYLESLGRQDGCFLCRYRDEPEADESNFVIWRGVSTLVLLNRFPYTGGHLLIAPYAHVPALADLDEPTFVSIMRLLRDTPRILAKAVKAQGFNIGLNLGRCAGAGLPDHLHLHVVPRWEGDTNFMSVVGDVRTMPVAFEEIYARVRKAGEALGLPDLTL